MQISQHVGMLKPFMHVREKKSRHFNKKLVNLYFKLKTQIITQKSKWVNDRKNT